MKISIAATNPCHLYPLAMELARLDALGAYYSGYPAWKLVAPAGFPLRTHSMRTTLVYGALKYLPENLRPSPRAMFLWQDHGFDAWVGRVLEACDALHAMPGQALHGFRRARALGVRTVLNHATGPVRDWVNILEPEYRRAGLRLTDHCPYDDAYFAREDEEYALAEYHCAASRVVHGQLVARGIPAGKIWLSPYGADSSVFHPRGRGRPGKFRIVFAGQLSLRKDIRTLLAAVKQMNRADWEMHFYGSVAPEIRPDLAQYDGPTPLAYHHAVSQAELAGAFRQSSVLVLPSLEEGFGLVVPQALNCGLPCIVSDRTGAADLIRHRDNGSIFPARNLDALAAELAWWEKNWRPVDEIHTWTTGAQALLTPPEDQGRSTVTSD